MDINQMFPSNHIKASDLAEQTVPAVISHCAVEQFDDSNKAVLFFSGREKGLVLNKTNAGVLADAFGSETDNWTGKTLELYAEQTTYMGKSCQGVRVRVTQPAATQPVQQPVEVVQSQPATPQF